MACELIKQNNTVVGFIIDSAGVIAPDEWGDHGYLYQAHKNDIP